VVHGSFAVADYGYVACISALHKLQKLAGEVAGMRAAHREAKDLQRNFTLYAFNKITEAQAALQEMAAHAQR
jgi:hypothetical protein